jgi:hypothetical protein
MTDNKMIFHLYKNAKSHHLFNELSNAFVANEGNLLKTAEKNEVVYELRLRSLLWGLNVAYDTKIRHQGDYRRHELRILETGMNQGFFAMVVDSFFEWALFVLSVPSFELTTFDVRSECTKSEEILKKLEHGVVNLIVGDTKTTLPAWLDANPNSEIDFVWVDGGHDTKTAESDIRCAMKTDAAVIAIDDILFKEVKLAVDNVLKENFCPYVFVRGPYTNEDTYKLGFLFNVDKVMNTPW